MSFFPPSSVVYVAQTVWRSSSSFRAPHGRKGTPLLVWLHLSTVTIANLVVIVPRVKLILVLLEWFWFVKLVLCCSCSNCRQGR